VNTTPVQIEVNGEEHRFEVSGLEVLLDTLRDRLDLTSVRGTCGIGICGTCTVLVDGRLESGCLTLTASADGRSVVTSEGLVEGGQLSNVQQAFVDAGAYQCSFCIPGFVLAVHAGLREMPSASAEDMRHYLAGNLCRCGTYPQIMDAVERLLGQREGAR